MKYLVENKAWDIVEDYNLDKLLYLLSDRPTVINKYYCCWLTKKRDTHRKYNLPAVVYECGDIEWWENENKLYDIKNEQLLKMVGSKTK